MSNTSRPCAGVTIAVLSAVVILGARNPRRTDLSSRIDDPSGVMGTSLIPTPCWPYVFPTSMTDNRIINNKTMGADHVRLPLCHLPAPPLPEDEIRVAFILYLLAAILYVFLNMLFIIYIPCFILSLTSPWPRWLRRSRKRDSKGESAGVLLSLVFDLWSFIFLSCPSVKTKQSLPDLFSFFLKIDHC